MKHRLATWAAAVLSAVVVVLLALHGARRPGRGAAPAPQRHEVARVRPGAGYRPKAEPLRHAPRPELPKPQLHRDAADVRTDEVAESPSDTAGGDSPGNAPAVPEPGAVADSGLESFSAETEFSARIWAALEASDEDLLQGGAEWLNSSSPEDRALGGVMLFFAKGLYGDTLDRVVGDEDPVVPLAVCDWIRDFGTESDIQMFKNALKTRGMADDELLEIARACANLPGGGRSALDLWLESFPEEGKPVEGLASLVASPDASYDVREQALFKLLEPETKAVGLEALKSFAIGSGAVDGGLFPAAAQKMSDLALVSNSDGDDEKIWDSEAAVVFFLSQAEGGLPARDLANYLEYALRRDDPEYEPIIEEGTWEFANDFLLETMPLSGTLPQVEVDALDRIAMSLDRLIDYDPAFNPFETVEDNGDEEVGDEIEEDDDPSADDDDFEADDDDAEAEEDDAEAEEDEEVEEDEEDSGDSDDEMVDETRSFGGTQRRMA